MRTHRPGAPPRSAHPRALLDLGAPQHPTGIPRPRPPVPERLGSPQPAPRSRAGGRPAPDPLPPIVHPDSTATRRSQEPGAIVHTSPIKSHASAVRHRPSGIDRQASESQTPPRSTDLRRSAPRRGQGRASAPPEPTATTQNPHHRRRSQPEPRECEPSRAQERKSANQQDTGATAQHGTQPARQRHPQRAEPRDPATTGIARQQDRAEQGSQTASQPDRQTARKPRSGDAKPSSRQPAKAPLPRRHTAR